MRGTNEKNHLYMCLFMFYARFVVKLHNRGQVRKKNL